MTKAITWDPEFAPSYSPMEMLDQGIFEGIYTAAIPNIPAKYKSHKNVLKRGSKPDVNINKYKVKSRQSLKEWQKKGWTTELSPLGWWQWMLGYYGGKRNPKEDKLQIKRWKSFVARHQGQIVKAGVTKDETKRVKQRQGLLQWAWDSTTPFTEAHRKKNLTRIAKSAGVPVETVSTESLPISTTW